MAAAVSQRQPSSSEDFYTRDTPFPDANKAAGDWEQLYFNGYPPGRIGYNAANSVLRPFLQSLMEHAAIEISASIKLPDGL